MAYVEEVSSDWLEVKRKNFILAMKKVMGNMTVAHRMVAEASQEMLNLLDEVKLPLWIKLADITMRPLVHLEIPELAIMCEEAKQICKGNEQNWDQTTKITTIMEGRNLPFLPTAWGYNKEGRAKKVIAGIIYKYVKDRMYDGKTETPATEVSEKYALNVTTMNRHILGKKYVGGKVSGSGVARRPAAVKVQAMERLVDKSKRKVKGNEEGQSSQKSKSTERPVDKSKQGTDANEDDPTTPKSKGKGKSSGVKRPAQVIRGESKSEQEKQKAKKRKEDAQLEEEEDEDRPTQEEIKKSGPPKKHISIR